MGQHEGMSVIIRCPLCAADVQLLPGGFVKEHGGDTPCRFVRTANNVYGGSGRAARSLADIAVAEAKAAEKAVAWQIAQERAKEKRIRDEESREQREIRKLKQIAAARLRNPLVQCPKCDSKVKQTAAPGKLNPHLRSDSNRWCSGGIKPTAAERKAALKGKPKRSVWSASGGLPTLGRRG